MQKLHHVHDFKFCCQLEKYPDVLSPRLQQPLNAWIAETRKFYPWSFPSRVLWYSPCSATSFSTELTFLDIEVFYGKSLALKKMFLFFRYFLIALMTLTAVTTLSASTLSTVYFKGTHNTHFFKMFFHLFLSLSHCKTG